MRQYNRPKTLKSKFRTPNTQINLQILGETKEKFEFRKQIVPTLGGCDLVKMSVNDHQNQLNIIWGLRRYFECRMKNVVSQILL